MFIQKIKLASAIYHLQYLSTCIVFNYCCLCYCFYQKISYKIHYDHIILLTVMSWKLIVLKFIFIKNRQIY